jgi:hypothetical protein
MVAARIAHLQADSVFVIIRQESQIGIVPHRQEIAVRSALVAALVAGAESSLKSRVRRFLRGLSCDELQFIASFLGACILESTGKLRGTGFFPGDVVELQGQGVLDRGSEDWHLKMILLIEFLCRSGIRQTSIPVRSEARLS